CEITAFMGRKVVTRSVPSAVAELRRAVDILGLHRIQVLDDTFTLSKRRVLAVCRELVAADLRIEFEIFSRTNTLDEEMMVALAKAGCVRVFFGIDGGDDEVLARVTKGIRIAEAEQTLRRAANYFEITASFIWGYPFETYAAFERMMDLVSRLNAHAARFAI